MLKLALVVISLLLINGCSCVKKAPEPPVSALHQTLPFPAYKANMGCSDTGKALNECLLLIKGHNQ